MQKRKTAASSKQSEALLAQINAMGGRDMRLSMFRALGKVFQSFNGHRIFKGVGKTLYATLRHIVGCCCAACS